MRERTDHRHQEWLLLFCFHLCVRVCVCVCLCVCVCVCDCVCVCLCGSSSFLDIGSFTQAVLSGPFHYKALQCKSPQRPRSCMQAMSSSLAQLYDVAMLYTKQVRLYMTKLS